VYVQDSSNITFIEGTFYSVITEQWETSIWNATVALPPHLVYYSEDVSITNQISNEKTCFYISGARLTLKKLPMQVKPTTVCNVTVAEYSPSKVRFTADAPANEVVTFTISGLKPHHRYEVWVDGDKAYTLMAGADGTIVFTWNTWSDREFEVRDVGSPPAEHYPPPVIPISTPSPPAVGWEWTWVLVGIVLLLAAIAWWRF